MPHFTSPVGEARLEVNKLTQFEMKDEQQRDDITSHGMRVVEVNEGSVGIRRGRGK